jgi:hypothetical protein
MSLFTGEVHGDGGSLAPGGRVHGVPDADHIPGGRVSFTDHHNLFTLRDCMMVLTYG